MLVTLLFVSCSERWCLLHEVARSLETRLCLSVFFPHSRIQTFHIAQLTLNYWGRHFAPRLRLLGTATSYIWFPGLSPKTSFAASCYCSFPANVVVKSLGLCHTFESPEWSSKTLALTWPAMAISGLWGLNWQMENTFHCLSLLFK